MSRTLGKLLLFVALLICLAGVVAYNVPTAAPPTAAVPPATSFVAEFAAKPAASRHPVYPFSLVSGGVYTVAVLRAAMAADPGFAAQFPGFNFARAHVVHLRGRLAYVSFRKNGRVYWTSKLQLLADDFAITDGNYTIRARCGNGVSYTRQVPTDPSVSSIALDTPVQEAPSTQVLAENFGGPQFAVDVVTPFSPTHLPTVYAAIGQPVAYIPIGQPYAPLNYPVSIAEPPVWPLALFALGALAGLLLLGRYVSWRPLIGRARRP